MLIVFTVYDVVVNLQVNKTIPNIPKQIVDILYCMSIIPRDYVCLHIFYL